MNELIITLLLTVPPAYKAISWDIGEIHNQVQVLHKYGLEVSYTAIRVPCNTVATQNTGRVVYHTKSKDQPVCYLVDTNTPIMVRHKDHWYPATSKTYSRGVTQ